MMTTTFFILAAGVYILTVIGVEGWRRLALRQKILDVPNERSSHVIPTPRGGGIIILAVTIIFLIASAAFNNSLDQILPFLIGVILIAIVSWLDDLYSVPSWLRLGIHIVAAVVVILGIGYFKSIKLPFYSLNSETSFFGQIITLLWIVGLTNAYNFMDGIDGIAGTQGLIAGIGWCLAGWLVNDWLILLFGGLIAATNFGFLWHNWHPARIFMGDVGSAFLGFSLAVLPILAWQRIENVQTKEKWTLFGVLMVWAFVFDAALTFIRRATRRENVFAAHRSHLYQRLVIAGYSHKLVTLVYGALTLISVALALIWLGSSQKNILDWAVVIILCVLSTGLWLFVRTVEKSNR